MVANKVFIAIPNTTAAPNAIRLCAPAPVANNNGITPSTKAKDVIKPQDDRTPDGAIHKALALWQSDYFLCLR